jgi:tetratricopeptide (TPR) repeat protein
VPPSAAPEGLDGALKEPDDENDEAERALEAMVDFRKADAALERNDLATAEQFAKKAVRGDPENAEYRALVAWLAALSGARESAKEALAELTLVLKDDAFCERALLYRGKLFKKENRNVEALRDFMTVLELNPRSNEAASEVRFLRMKRKK